MADMKVGAPLVAIHQPNFLPWLGFFDKLRRADIFIVLDDAQFPKKGGTWMNRVRVLLDGRPAWFTIPVERAYPGLRSIDQVRFRDDSPWRTKRIETLRHAYRRAPSYEEVLPLLASVINEPCSRLAPYNLHGISAVAGAVGLSTEHMVMASSLGATSTGTRRLVELVESVGGGAYLFGGGAAGYQEDHLFAERGIGVVPQSFAHPVYEQGVSPFVAGLSILDALFWCGIGGVRKLLADGMAR